MSNKLLLLLILGVVFFSACSDDDKDPNYDGTYKDSGLELSRDGMVLSGKSVALSGNTLTLGNVIPGEPALAIPVTITGSAVEDGASPRATRAPRSSAPGPLRKNPVAAA